MAHKYEFTDEELHEIKEALRKREKDLKRKRADLDGFGATPDVIQGLDDEIKVIKGDGPLHPGLKAKLGIVEKKDETQLEHGEGEDPIDATQSPNGKPDYRTWEYNVSGVEELVAAIASSDKPAPAKVVELNRLEDGEQEREPKPRDGALRAIRNTRRAIVEAMPPAEQSGPVQ